MTGMFGQLGQTVTVINKSGKVVSTSKHIVNVFKEAKAAYRERKAEIHASRAAEHEDDAARYALKRLTLEDQDETSSKGSHARRSKSVRHPRKPPVERGYTDSFYANDPPQNLPTEGGSALPPTYTAATDRAPPRVKRSHTSPLQEHNDVDLALAYGEDFHGQELIRRHSDTTQLTSRRAHPSRSTEDIDMDLAYGELPPPLPPRRYDEGAELRGKVTKLQAMLDEANCLQHTATTTIEHLQKNPEALAAVGLALAEISTLARKMGPGALTALRGAFPAIFALLASPQFLIATGVGVGVVVVMLGGYKIVKRIRDNREIEAEAGALVRDGELRELDPELSHIERWRRGIAEAEAESVGTTVDGEFITPMASRLRLEEGTLKPEDLKSSKSGRRKSVSGKTASRKARSSKSVKGKEQDKKKKKGEHSSLRSLFKGHSS